MTDAVDLERASRALLAVSVRAMAQLESTVSPSQLRALLVLEASGPQSLHRVAQELGTGDGAASRLVDRLVTAGLVDRQPGDDRRTVSISLTGSGLEVLDELGRTRSRALEPVVARLDADEQAQLVRGLQAFTRAAATA